MNDRVELLKRWSEVAPGECIITKKEDDDFTVRWGTAEWYATNLMPFRSLLLLALIEAIRARGWHYTLESDETEQGNEQPCAWHRAVVVEKERAYEVGHLAAEPCDALLKSYIATLEREASRTS